MDRPIDERVVHRLWLAGALPRGGYLPAVGLARDAAFWRRWGERVVLGLAAGHLLSAVIFFFAFNWQDLAPLAKLAVLQAGIVACALASRTRVIPEAAREMLLLGASVLVGVLLAVFGQVYQTGADAWTLFAGWAALILPWVLAGRSAAHWLVWLIVVQTALLLGLADLDQFRGDGETWLWLLLALPAWALLAAREALAGRLDWLSPGWTRVVPLLIALGPWFAVAVAAVFDGWTAEMLPLLAALPLLAGVYGRWRPDFPALAILTLAACGFASAVMMQLTDPDDFAGGFYLLALEVTLIFGAGSWALRKIHRRMLEVGHV